MAKIPVYVNAQRIVSIPSKCRLIRIYFHAKKLIYTLFFLVVTFLLHFLQFHFVTIPHPMLNVFYYPNVFQHYFKISYIVMITIIENNLTLKMKIFFVSIVFFKIKFKQQNWNITIKQKQTKFNHRIYYIHKIVGEQNKKMIRYTLPEKRQIYIHTVFSYLLYGGKK